MNPYPQHCDECGAYLATATDQDLHRDWHRTLNAAISEIARTADHADSFNRPLGGRP